MKRWWILAALIALGAVLVFALLLCPAQAPQAGARLLAAADRLDEIIIDAVFDPESRTLTVSQSFTLTNHTGSPQPELILRTYAAAMRDEEYAPSATEELHSLCYPGGFSAGGFEITSENLRYSYMDDAQTVLSVSLDTPWQNGDTLTQQLDYILTIPQASYRFGVDEGVYAIGNVFIIPAAYIDGEYFTEPYYSIGDPFISECRNYTVHITLPQGYAAAGSGMAEIKGQTTTFTALASRDFALSISKDFHRAAAVHDGIMIEAYGKSAITANTMLKTAKDAMRIYTDLFGVYPYPCFTLAEGSLPFDGMSYPSFAMIASDVFSMSEESAELRIAREVAKQWFQQVAGTNNYYQPWQHEALTEYALLRYWQQKHGAAAREALQYSHADTAMRLSVGTLTPGSPLNYFYNWSEYITMARYQGAAALCTMELALGSTLDDFLREYYDTYAFQIATRNDFIQAINAYSGQDWTPLMNDYLDTI